MSKYIYLIWIEDSSVKIPVGYPILEYNYSEKFHKVCLEVTSIADLSSVVSDLRSNYIKSRNGLRSKTDSMDLLSYVEKNKHLKVRKHLLETHQTDESLRMSFDILRLKYLIVYRDRFICNNTRLMQSLENITKPIEIAVPDVPPDAGPVVALSPVERRRLAQKKYADTHREAQRAKCRKYYERNRERILADLAKKRNELNSP
jgi:hypothetical protein